MDEMRDDAGIIDRADPGNHWPSVRGEIGWVAVPDGPGDDRHPGKPEDCWLCNADIPPPGSIFAAIRDMDQAVRKLGHEMRAAAPRPIKWIIDRAVLIGEAINRWAVARAERR